MDGSEVLNALHSIYCAVADSLKDKITAKMWTITSLEIQMSEDFVGSTQDSQDMDFSKAQETELLNQFVV